MLLLTQALIVFTKTSSAFSTPTALSSSASTPSSLISLAISNFSLKLSDSADAPPSSLSDTSLTKMFFIKTSYKNKNALTVVRDDVNRGTTQFIAEAITCFAYYGACRELLQIKIFTVPAQE